MFESRLYFVDHLIGMGAKIVQCDPHRVVVTGPTQLAGSTVTSPDIRAGIALILAALCAKGTTTILNAESVDRGYEAVEKELCEFTDVTPKTRGPLIDNDQLDIIAATYTITDERKKSWDFSTPYRTDHVGILIKKKSGMTKMADLDGKIIGVSQGSTTKDLVLQMLKDQNADATPEFKEFPDYPSIKSALDAGNIDAFAMDRSTLKGYTTDDCELLEPDVEFGAQDYGVATKKDSDLSKTVDDTVKKLKEDGWLDEEYTKWDLL